MQSLDEKLAVSQLKCQSGATSFVALPAQLRRRQMAVDPQAVGRLHGPHYGEDL